MQINPMKELYTDFLEILEGCEIKYRSKADECETLQTKKDSDAYIKAYRNEDNFNTYYKYDKDILAEVLGIYDETEIEKYYSNRNLIPSKYRSTIVSKQRQKIIDNYVEKNNYYRCLNGLPDYEEPEDEYVYPSEDIVREYKLPEGVPVHELSDNNIATLNTLGHVDELIALHPTKTYLKYLGAKKIDLITSRTASNFALIYIPSALEDTIWNNFTSIYEQCREYFVSCIYITEYRKIIDYYDNFIAMCIMIMTLQQLFARVLKNTIERDFFDPYCVKLLFETYGVPYNSNMDSSTKSLIVQNLNLLIQNKGTNKAIYDISSILGYDRLKIYKYYLVKAQKFDEDTGLPIQATKIDESTGEEVPDYESMFNIYFQRVNIDAKDTYEAMQELDNRIDYNEIVDDDPYWVEDENLLEEMYESEYNFVESKYMGVSISYKMTNILFENMYLLRMILDKKDDIPKINLQLPRINTEKEYNLFDIILFMCAMTCKQNNLKGEILVTPSKILHVMGFNYETDFDKIRKEILEDPNLDDSLIDFFKDSSAVTATKINNLYTNYVELYDVLLEKMATTQDIDTYYAYKKFYNTIFYTNENKEIFNIGTPANPVYASTYMEYIKATNPEMYDFINDMDEDQIYTYIDHIATKIMSIIPDLSNLGIISDASSSMEDMLVQLIRFFKSYTTDMLGFNTIFIFDLKPETIIRFIDEIDIIYNCIEKDDKFYISYNDSITPITKINGEEYLTFSDECRTIVSED